MRTVGRAFVYGAAGAAGAGATILVALAGLSLAGSWAVRKALQEAATRARASARRVTHTDPPEAHSAQ